FYHDLSDGVKTRKSHAGELLRRRGPLRGEITQDSDDIIVTGDHPYPQQRIPMHGRFVAQAMVEGIRIRQHFRVQQTRKTERSLALWRSRFWGGERHCFHDFLSCI